VAGTPQPGERLGAGLVGWEGIEVVIKEATASAFVFGQDPGSGRWRLALVDHSRLGEWMPPGGHVEPDESAAEAAVREVREETGLAVRLVPGPALPVPDGFPHAAVEPAWWIVEMRANPDGHTAEPHIHLDHVFVAVADEVVPVDPAVHRFAWFSVEDIAAADGIAEDSRLQAKELFTQLHKLAVVA
jgi:8-oxo-dGTP pyrophosphatase MutT (NUDIX family)